MEKDTQNGKSAQGAAIPKSLTEAQVLEFTKKDISACMHMLDAIYRDQATMEMLASVLYGRYQNAKHKAELEKQTEIKI